MKDKLKKYIFFSPKNKTIEKYQLKLHQKQKKNESQLLKKKEELFQALDILF